MIINQAKITNILSDLLKKENLNQIKSEVSEIKNNLINFRTDKLGLLNIVSNGETIKVEEKFIQGEVNQILETQTLERTKYYIQRLIKSLTETKTSKINDLNLHRWKEYDDIITDSLWVLDKRDNSGAHNAGYWGNFIPQIPNQFLKRYTKQGDWVLDTFLGSGTTLIECKRLGRNGIGVELNPKVVELAEKNISKIKSPFDNLKL